MVFANLIGRILQQAKQIPKILFSRKMLKMKRKGKGRKKKYRGADLNRRPSGYESDALTS